MIRITWTAALKIDLDQPSGIELLRPGRLTRLLRMSGTKARPVDVLLCAAAEDDALVRELDSHLAALKGAGLLRSWHGGSAAAGEDRRVLAREMAQKAQMIVPLLSADFLAENPDDHGAIVIALARHSRRAARIVPVLARPCVLAGTPYADLQPLPAGRAAVTQWPSRDEAWSNVVAGIRTAIQPQAGTGK